MESFKSSPPPVSSASGTRELEASGEGNISFAQEIEGNSSTGGGKLLDLLALESFRTQLLITARQMMNDAFPDPGAAQLVGVNFCFGDENGNWMEIGLGQTKSEDGDED